MKLYLPKISRTAAVLASLALGASVITGECLGQDENVDTNENGGFGNISSFLPLDQPQNDVRIPSLTPLGAIKTLIEADVVTRIDDTNLRLKNMIITLYDEEGEPNMRVLTAGAVYDVKTGILTSDQRTRSVHADFVMEGDGMTFNTESRVGKMSGNVVTHILRADFLGTVTQEPKPEQSDEE